MQHITWSVQYNNHILVISGISYDNILSDTHVVKVPAGVVPNRMDIDCITSWLYECDARVGDTRTLDETTYRLIDKSNRVLPDPPRRNSVLEYYNEWCGSGFGVVPDTSSWDILNEIPLGTNVGQQCKAIIDTADGLQELTPDVIEPAVDWAMVASQCVILYTA